LESDPRLIFRLHPTSLVQFEPGFLDQKLKDKRVLESCDPRYLSKLLQSTYRKLDQKLLAKLSGPFRQQLDPNREGIGETFNLKLLGLYLWPQLNFRQLEDAESLMLLLHSRASHAPGSFIAADHRASRFRWRSVPLETATIDEYILYFKYTGETSDGDQENASYGNLIRSDDSAQHNFSCSPLLWFAPFHGLLALKL
jgi:hypothetical protein